jgi:hypothetical protein
MPGTITSRHALSAQMPCSKHALPDRKCGSCWPTQQARFDLEMTEDVLAAADQEDCVL